MRGKGSFRFIPMNTYLIFVSLTRTTSGIPIFCRFYFNYFDFDVRNFISFCRICVCMHVCIMSEMYFRSDETANGIKIFNWMVLSAVWMEVSGKYLDSNILCVYEKKTVIMRIWLWYFWCCEWDRQYLFFEKIYSVLFY